MWNTPDFPNVHHDRLRAQEHQKSCRYCHKPYPASEVAHHEVGCPERQRLVQARVRERLGSVRLDDPEIGEAVQQWLMTVRGNR